MSYQQELKAKLTQDLRDIQNELPYFCKEFFRGVEEKLMVRTKIVYAQDLRLFFTFLTEQIPMFRGTAVRDFSIEQLRQITLTELEEFIDYLNLYVQHKEGGREREYTNERSGKQRKIATLRTLFSYFYKKQKIDKNPAELLETPKIPEKVIVRLEVQEVARLLDEIESGENLTRQQQNFHQYTKARDLALVTLLLGTGMRISECVGLDVKDLDFEELAVKVTRKGGDEAILHYGDEVAEALEAYLVKRDDMRPKPGHEDALFLSLQRSRLTSRAIQNLVKKYSQLVTQLKNITPHKLRSTYGTNLYHESGDIYLVADALGHKNIETTRRHYAAMSEDRRREAAKYIKLRKE